MGNLAFLHNLKDNVAVALTNLRKGDMVEVKREGESIKVNILDDTAYGHKFALQDLKRGEKVIKYGEVIGVATKDIRTGNQVHIHNIKSLRY